MFKLLAVDLDGTLLNSQKRISRENKDAIKLAQKKGIKVVICSGRIFAGARMFAHELQLKGPLIACNGAIIRDLESGEILYSDTMRCEDYWQVVEICRREGIYFHTYIGDVMYTERLEYSSKFYYERNKEVAEESRFDIRVVDNAREIVTMDGGQATKVVAISQDLHRLYKVRNEIEKISTVTVTSSDKGNFEVLNLGVSKGRALKFLCDKLDIKQQETIAMGDNENDCSMLEYAGIGIAMENAEDSVKRMADDITLSNDEHGVAKAIQKYLL